MLPLAELGKLVEARIALRRGAAGGVRVASVPPMDDAEIIRRFLEKRDDALFAQLVERYQQRVFRLAMSILGPGREAEGDEVAQTVFVRVFQQLPRFRGESKFSTWLYRIAWNCAIDEKNRATRAEQRNASEELLAVVETSAAESPYEQAAGAQRRVQLRAAMDELPETYQMTLRLHYWLGCSVEEIAELMGTSAGTVKSYLFRARARLHEQLTQEHLSRSRAAREGAAR